MSYTLEMQPTDTLATLANPRVSPTTLTPSNPPLLNSKCQEVWRFRLGRVGLNGLKTGALAAPIGSLPSYSPDYLTLSGTANNGIEVPITESLGQTCFLIFRNTQPTTSRVFMGTNAFPTSGGGWHFIYNQGTGTYQIVTAAPVTDTETVTIPNGVALNEWLWIGISHTATTVGWLVGGGSYTTGTYTGYTASTRKLGIGDAYYSAAFTQAHDIAGFSVCNTALSSSDMAAAYANDKTEAASAIPTPFTIF